MKVKQLNKKNILSLAGKYAAIQQLFSMKYKIYIEKNLRNQIIVSVINKKSNNEYSLIINSSVSVEKEVNSTDFGKVLPWLLKDYHEKKVANNLFYCFVFFDDEVKHFRFFIVPSNIVAEFISKTHRLWMTLNEKRKETSTRNFMIGFKGEKYPYPIPLEVDYEDKWNFLQ